LLRVLVVLGLNATLKLIRPSSSSSSSFTSNFLLVQARHIQAAGAAGGIIFGK